MKFRMTAQAPLYCPAWTESNLTLEADTLREVGWWSWAQLTPTLMPRADIDAVHRHVDLILYALPSLVIVVDQVTI